MLQQTIISPIEQNKICILPDENGNEGFVQTEHDLKVSDFIQSLSDNECQVISILNAPNNSSLITVVQFADKEETKQIRMSQSSLLAGLKVPK